MPLVPKRESVMRDTHPGSRSETRGNWGFGSGTLPWGCVAVPLVRFRDHGSDARPRTRRRMERRAFGTPERTEAVH